MLKVSPNSGSTLATATGVPVTGPVCVIFTLSFETVVSIQASSAFIAKVSKVAVAEVLPLSPVIFPYPYGTVMVFVS